MNTKFTVFLLLNLILHLNLSAQTPLPYYTGFDNTTEKAGWTEFRKGITTSYNWSIAAAGSFSAPNCISHDYPVGSSSTDTTVDWFVSPQFNFAGGGKIDSIKVNIYSITGNVTPVDQLQLYLLNGSNDPSSATSVVLLATLTGMVSTGFSYKDTFNITIPATSGMSYIGIKYRATNNWFTIKIDNIKISGSGNGIKESGATNAAISLYPNPGSQSITLHTDNKDLLGKVYHLNIYNALGQQVFSGVLEPGQVINHGLPAGNYFYHLLSGTDAIRKGPLTVVN
jgi:hypothetical protein